MHPDLECISAALDMSPDELAAADATRLELVETVDARGRTSSVSAVAIEEVLVWRVLALRIMRDLGERGLFTVKKHGANEGTVVVHPGLECLAKAYERTQKRMHDLMATFDDDQEGPAGLPDIMKDVLKQTEGVLEAALRPGSRQDVAQRPKGAGDDGEPLADHPRA